MKRQRGGKRKYGGWFGSGHGHGFYRNRENKKVVVVLVR